MTSSSQKTLILQPNPVPDVKPRKKSAQREHYVNNAELLQALIKFRNASLEAKERGEPRPDMGNYIGSCFLKMATRISYKNNFMNYAFREDMISDGIQNCIEYIHNFDPAKSKNPFAYFSQIIHFAFLRRITREKRQLAIKDKIIDRAGFEVVMSGGDNVMSGSSRLEYDAIKDSIQIKSHQFYKGMNSDGEGG